MVRGTRSAVKSGGATLGAPPTPPPAEDPDAQRWREFELEAWDAYGEVGRIPKTRKAAQNQSRTAWNNLNQNDRDNIARAIQDWRTQEELVVITRDITEEQALYQGHESERLTEPVDEGLPTFDQYVRQRQFFLDVLGEAALRATTLLNLCPDSRSPAIWNALLQDRHAADIQGIEQWMAVEVPRIRPLVDQKLRLKNTGDLNGRWVPHPVSHELPTVTHQGPKVFVKTNEDGRIQDRVVIKDSDFALGENTAHLWRESELWTGAIGTSVPTEIQALYNLRGLIGSSSVIKIRNYRLGNRRHRQYLEWCPHKDLDDLVKVVKALREELGSSLDDEIPEAFLWHVFACLVNAGILMERGELEEYGIKHWDMLIHRDWKTSNVFMGARNPDRFRGWPEPKIADFGYCIIGKPNDDPAVDDFAEFGTPNARSPEQMKQLRDPAGALKPMTSKTNVWGVGFVMYSIITGEESVPSHPRGPGLDFEKDPDIRMPPDFTAEQRVAYSNELRSLIWQCIQYQDTDRPTFSELHAKIQMYTTPGSATDLTGGLRDAPETDEGFRYPSTEYFEDSWAVDDNDWQLMGDQMPDASVFAVPDDDPDVPLGGPPNVIMQDVEMEEEEDDDDNDDDDEEPLFV